MTAPAFSIVIAAYGKREYSERCLASVDAAFGARIGADVELVLVDNASPDSTLELFDAWRDRATVIALPENRNFAGGYNAGAAAATGDVLVLLNNDTIIPSGALDVLVDEACNDDVGIVGVRLVYPDGTLQHGGFGWHAEGTGPVHPFHLFHHEAGDLAVARCRYDLNCVTGACLVLRRSLFTEVDGFDEQYVNGWEDVDLCLRLRARGLRVVYRGDVSLIHDEGATSGGDYGLDHNQRRFRERWTDELAEDANASAARFGGERFASFGPLPGRHPEGAELIVRGHLTGISPDGDEARALLRGFADTGLASGARNVVPTIIGAALDGSDHQAIFSALGRSTRPGAPLLQVDTHAGPLPTAIPLLLTADPERAAAAQAELTWVPSEAIAAAAVARGADPGAVRVLRPCVEVPAGRGGGGVLALLPAHDEARCRIVVDALRDLTDRRIAVLPSVDLPWLAELAATVAGATWLPPVSVDTAAAEVMGDYDVVIAADGDDRRQRRALVAAATGAAVVLLDAGPASEVLGSPLCAVAPPDAAAIAAAVRGFADDRARPTRIRRVQEACGPAAIAGAVSARVAELAARRAAAIGDRPSVLVVAAEPPTPDRDAGSLRRSRLLQLLLDEGYRVTYIARRGAGFERYLAELEEMGVEVYANDPDKLVQRGEVMAVPPIDMEAILRERLYSFALLTPFEVAEQYIDDVRRWSPLTPVIIDTVDVHFLREQRGAELRGDAQGLVAAAQIREREREVYSRADALIAVSEQDASILRELAPGVPIGIIATVHGPEPTGAGFDGREGLLFVGGFRHLPNVDAVQWFVDEVLPEVRVTLPDVPVWIVGSNAPPEITAMDGRDGVRVLGFVPSTEPWLARARLSIAPLRFGAGVKGKIGEALAYGVPVVTTTIGTEGMPLEGGRHVMVGDDAPGFAAATVRAYQDADLWDALRRDGREQLLQELGFGAALRGWREITDQLRVTALFLAEPAWDDGRQLRELLSSYVGAFGHSDPVSLVMALGHRVDPRVALERTVTALTDLGHDPEAVPDIDLRSIPDMSWPTLPPGVWRVAFAGATTAGAGSAIRADAGADAFRSLLETATTRHPQGAHRA